MERGGEKEKKRMSEEEEVREKGDGEKENLSSLLTFVLLCLR